MKFNGHRCGWVILNIRTIHFQGWEGVLVLFTRRALNEGGLVILGGDGEPFIVQGKAEDSSVVRRHTVLRNLASAFSILIRESHWLRGLRHVLPPANQNTSVSPLLPRSVRPAPLPP